jgi:hypothetical protein
MPWRFLGVPARLGFGVRLREQLCGPLRELRPGRRERLVLPRRGALSSITVFVIPAQAGIGAILLKHGN